MSVNEYLEATRYELKSRNYVSLGVRPAIVCGDGLRALLSAIALTAAGCQPSAEYAAGFSAALTAMAVGLGLEEMPAQQTQTFTIEKPQWVRLGVVR